MTGKKLARAAVCAVLAGTLALAAPVAALPAAAASLSDMQGRQADLKAKQAEIDAKLARLKSDKANRQAYAESLNAKVENTEEQIGNLDGQISGLDADIVKKQAAISGKQKEIDANFTKLKQRVYALYLTGEASGLEIVLNAKSIMDLADKTELLQVIAEHDTALIDTIRGDLSSIRAQKNAIESSRAEAAAKRTEADRQRRDLKTQQAAATEALSKLSASEQATAAEKQKNAAAQEAANAAVDEWFANYYAEQKRKQEEARQTTPSSSTPSNNSSPSDNGTPSNSSDTSSNSSPSDGGGTEGTGNFTWPVPSYSCISQYYGSYDMGSFHKGVDIVASYGAPIVAADVGTVIASVRQDHHGTYGGYGNVVVIDHGNGFSTLYAHMSSRAVSEGDSVSKGQVIGYMGSTGESTGTHCHFEVRVNGSAVNPMSYFG